MEYAIDLKINLDTDGGADSIGTLVKEIKKVSIACEGIVHILSKGKFGTSFVEATEKAKQLEKVLEKVGNEGVITIGQGAKQAKQAVVEASITTQKAVEQVGKKVEEGIGKKISKFGTETVFGFTNILQSAKRLFSFLSEPLAKAGQFETMQMQLEVVMGSADKAKQRFKELANFTKGTTFEVSQVVEAGKELQLLGKYSKETLTTLSNLAMGSGKSLDDITKAYTALVKGKKNMAMELFRDIGITTQEKLMLFTFHKL